MKSRVHNSNSNLYTQGIRKVRHIKYTNCHIQLDSLKYSWFHIVHVFDIEEGIIMDVTYFRQENPDQILSFQKFILQAKLHCRV